MITHYLPPFTRLRGVHQQAACGKFILPQEHSAEPRCAACKAYVEREATLDAAMEATAAEPFDPAGAVDYVDFDPVVGRPRRR